MPSPVKLSHLAALSAALEAAGLGSYREAHDLLLRLHTQAGGTPEHHAAHAAMLTSLSPSRLREFYALAEPEARRCILARLAFAGWGAEALVELATTPREKTV